jgi:hypothetical protein
VVEASAPTIRPFRPGDEEAVNAGFNAAFGLARPLAEWRWKFPQTPERRRIVLAVDATGAVLAHFAVVPVRFQAAGGVLLAGQAVDSYSRRRLGLARENLFQRTVRAFYDLHCSPSEIALLYGFPGTRHLRLGLSQLGYLAPQPVAYWRRPLPPRAPRPLLRSHDVTDGFDPAALDELWTRSRRRYPFAAVRDSAWLSRRFTGRPGADYLHLQARRGGRCEAWAVLRPTADQPLRWVELLWDGEDPRALDALDRAADDFARLVGASHLDLWLSGDPAAAAAFAARGWQQLPEPHDLHVAFVPFHPELDVPSLAPQLYYTLGDSDLA